MLKLLDVMSIQKEDLHKYKLHLAINPKNKKEPLYELFKGTFKSWQEWQNKKNFERDYILSLIYYGRDEWIFGGIYKRKDVKRVKDHFEYDTELLDFRKDLIGRLIIHFPRPGRQSYLNLERWVNELKVVEILRKPYTVKEFPGYENVLIDFDLLKTIIEREEPSWKTALSSVKGVYIITNKDNGKFYIGSAYGEDSFWSRWALYAKNGHGGNKELKNIIDKKGLKYASNFQFSILEVRSNITDDEEIIKRESHWKNVLKSREFGYNEN
ncbi:MAG: GIY-YIG nuclease family protein [Candidatus Aenigmarchaeota archaeon]|nr:GIY-YIG nuclease family protein [Candidatus Aenigmarchaeota archaeon]